MTEEKKEEIKTEEKKEFEYDTKIDMKIYDVDKKDAIWFKQWCGKLDLRMNLGFKVLRIITDYASTLKVLSEDILELKERIDKIEEKPDKPKTIKTFGGNRRKKDVTEE